MIYSSEIWYFPLTRCQRVTVKSCPRQSTACFLAGLYCGVVINSGLSPRSLDEPASLEWCGMREILPILDRFEENDQKCIFLRSNLDCFNH
ncbi:hypothetical protein ELR99_25350 [Salmonella enterica subsp. enterica serovar Newport]|nr:hypothetical protein [Salmonella enterica subsp. enterica serovar Newport]